MKVVLLAGGLGSRLGDETQLRPKPMVEIGGYPILWHIMKLYESFGFNEFIVCLGYKGDVIREYFGLSDRQRTAPDLPPVNGSTEQLRIELVDTGLETMTGGRLARIRHLLDPDEPFLMTYGDGLGDIDLAALLRFHREQGLDATVTAVRPPARFGALSIEGDRVIQFEEKPLGDGGWINGGFFVLEPRVLDRIDGDHMIWEAQPLTALAREGQLAAFRHGRFWQPMDTPRDRTLLEELWASGEAPWKLW